MSRRRNIDVHRRNLGEIREIMNSMKSLAYIETRKLTKRLAAQRAVVASIETAARDFLSFFPNAPPSRPDSESIRLVIGTERGFCGDLNQRLWQHATAAAQDAAPERLLVVGRKLHGLFEDDSRVAAFLDGAETAEEVATVLNRIVAELSALQTQHAIVPVSLTYVGMEHEPRTMRLLPAFADQAASQEFAYPPVLNLSAPELLLALTDQYLLAALNEILYSALMEENHRRVTHLDGAVNHLDEQMERLGRRLNELRQEEIIEEIEIILLSAVSS
jgi:F-type H+-transporting ATPase subunit gamma